MVRGCAQRQGIRQLPSIPIYACPELREGMSAELKKRVQGKGCFNFKKVDAKLFKELGQLTKSGLQKFSDPELVRKITTR